MSDSDVCGIVIQVDVVINVCALELSLFYFCRRS